MTILSSRRLGVGGNTRWLVLMLAVISPFAPHALAQCEPQWLQGEGVAGLLHFPYAMQTWDDGTGEALYVGGTIALIGQQPFSNIARWDGSTWSALGAGVDNGVWAMTVYNGDLIVGGGFRHAGGTPVNCIARWDGQTWHPLGLGVSGEPTEYISVASLTVFDGDLIVTGAFSRAGGLPAFNVARWDGIAWHAMGNGLNRYATDAAVYNGELIVTGTFTASGGQPVLRIAKWDGDGWETLGGGLNFWGDCLALFEGGLVVGGFFSQAGSVAARNIARWDGTSWHTMGNEIEARVEDLVVHDGRLVALGWLTLWPPDVPLRHVAQWDGAAWSSVGGGTNDGTTTAASFQGDLYVGGGFTLAGETPVANLARWDGANWSAVAQSDGINGPVNALHEHAGQLIAGGEFTMIGGTAATAIARFDGTTWLPLGDEIRKAVTPARVNALTEFAGDLIAAGGFRLSDTSALQSVARWDGTLWHAMGDGLYGSTYDFAEFDGRLIAAGYLHNYQHIAQWDGAANAWRPFAGGGADGEVRAAVTLGDHLIIGGEFTTVGGRRIWCLARWDGREWSTFGEPFKSDFGEIEEMIVFNGELFVYGAVDWPDVGYGRRAARWDEAAQSWDMASDYMHVQEFRIIDGALYAAASDAIVSNALFRWNGDTWQAVSGSADNPIETFIVYGGDRFVGGYFVFIDGVVSPFLARAHGGLVASDLTCDGVVNIDDLLALLGAWGPCPAPPASCPADIAPRSTPDGVVDIADIELLILNWN